MSICDRITFELAKPVVINHAKKRVKRFNLSANEELVLKTIVQKDSIQVKEISKALGKQSSYISTILAQLLAYKLVSYKKEWRNHYYYASIDAHIAYSNDE